MNCKNKIANEQILNPNVSEYIVDGREAYQDMKIVITNSKKYLSNSVKLN